MQRWFFLLGTLAISGLGLGLAACSAGKQADPVDNASCPAVDASTCLGLSSDFDADIQPILNRACNSTCHAPGVGPWPFTDEGNFADWGGLIQSDLESCAMPPPDASAGSGNLTTAERQKIIDWIVCNPPSN